MSAPSEASREERWSRRRRGRPAWQRIGLLVLLVALLSLLSYALLLPVRQTEIELIVDATYLEFNTPLVAPQDVPEQQILLTDLGVRELGVVNATRVSFGGQKPLQSKEGETATLELTAQSQGSTISLGQVKASEGTVVELGVTEPHQYRLTVIGEGLTLSATVKGPIHAFGSGYVDPLPERLDSPFATSVTVTPPLNRDEREELQLDLSTQPSENPTLASQVTVNQLRLYDVLDLSDTVGGPIRRVSAIESGSLFFEDLGGEEVELRPGEPLTFASAEGVIRRINLDDRLTLQFRGSVRGMATGFSESARSLMPTYIERFLANNVLMTALAGLVVVLSLIASFMQAFAGRSD